MALNVAGPCSFGARWARSTRFSFLSSRAPTYSGSQPRSSLLLGERILVQLKIEGRMSGAVTGGRHGIVVNRVGNFHRSIVHNVDLVGLAAESDAVNFRLLFLVNLDPLPVAHVACDKILYNRERPVLIRALPVILRIPRRPVNELSPKIAEQHELRLAGSRTFRTEDALVITCTGVSFAHGSNDGQKGMGLIMLILIGILPGVYAINPTVTAAGVAGLVSDNKSVQPILDAKAGSGAQITGADAKTALSDFLKYGAKAAQTTFVALAYENRAIAQIVGTAPTFGKLTDDQRKDLRTKSYLVGESIGKLTKPNKTFTAPGDAKTLGDYKKELDGMTKFIPVWVKFMVALCLGIGTMIGWKRIVVTIGEKIGKSHLTYAQGASAELVTMATIQGADILGLPVSTTHILSSSRGC